MGNKKTWSDYKASQINYRPEITQKEFEAAVLNIRNGNEVEKAIDENNRAIILNPDQHREMHDAPEAFRLSIKEAQFIKTRKFPKSLIDKYKKLNKDHGNY